MARNPLFFTVAFDLVSSDDYGAFIAGIRDRLGNPRHVSHGRPVLPPVEPGVPPRRWFHVRLRTPSTTLTLATRADNLCLAGFQSADGTWWELSSHGILTRRSGLIPGATPLGIGGTYRDLAGGTRELTNVPLGRRQMMEAVYALAAHTQDSLAAAAAAAAKKKQRRLVKDALLVLLLMVHEATRFLDVEAVLAGLMRPDAAHKTGSITRNSTAKDLGWRHSSSLLLSADSGGRTRSAGEYAPRPHEDKAYVESVAATVGILLFVQVESGITANNALRLFHGYLCGTGRDGTGPDVTFFVSGESVAAHRYILAGKSGVFLRQFVGKRAPPHVEVKDMDAASFKAMIHYIYTDTVPEFEQQRRRPEEEEAVTMMAYHLLVAADRYGLDRLKLVCKRKLESGALCVDIAAETLALAQQHNYQQLKAKCISFIAGATKTLRAVLATEGYKRLEANYPSVLTEILKCVHGREVKNLDRGSCTCLGFDTSRGGKESFAKKRKENREIELEEEEEEG